VYNSYTIKCTDMKCSVWWVLTIAYTLYATPTRCESSHYLPPNKHTSHPEGTTFWFLSPLILFCLFLDFVKIELYRYNSVSDFFAEKNVFEIPPYYSKFHKYILLYEYITFCFYQFLLWEIPLLSPVLDYHEKDYYKHSYTNHWGLYFYFSWVNISQSTSGSQYRLLFIIDL
jgi:hypothetical protein